MKKLKATTIYLFLCLFLAANISFATTDTDNRKPPNNDAIESDCGFFCTIGEFFEDLF